MSTEEVIKRTSVMIQTEYAKICSIAGDKQYKIQMLKSEMDQICNKLYALNQEYEAALKAEKEAKLPDAEVVTLTPEAQNVDVEPQP